MNNRRILTTRLPAGAASADALVRGAIRRRTCLSAIYNRNAIRLAPHALYTKHGEYYVDGVVLERDGQPPREKKLGSFKLAGLHGLAPAPLPFDPEPVFDPAAERYAEDAVLIEPVG